MKFQIIDLLCGKNSPKQMIPKVPLQAIFAIVLFTAIPLLYTLSGYPPSSVKNKASEKTTSSAIFADLNVSTSLPSTSTKKCDIFTGEWVPNPEAPYYTNKTCWAIHEHQNCMKYGRPDSEFMKWRWKPNGCDLPIFNPFQFLEILRGKSMAFVGDSVARNQMQSLVCLLSRAEWPADDSKINDDYFRRWKYPSYNFTLAAFWTTHLITSKQADSNGPTGNGLFNLYLDEVDQKWASQVEDFDYIIISTGHWFFRPLVYYERKQRVGCRFCQLENVTDLSIAYAYRKAFRIAFRTINSLKNYKGTTILRTFAPSHFENGLWNEGGNCVRTKPFRSSEIRLEGTNLDLYRAQLEEFRIAEKEGRKKGLKYRLLDATKAMLLRPDGHPSRYGHWPHENVTLYNDCVHWCLPGPIDTWSDFLLQMLKMEGVRSAEERLYMDLN